MFLTVLPTQTVFLVHSYNNLIKIILKIAIKKTAEFQLNSEHLKLKQSYVLFVYLNVLDIISLKQVRNLKIWSIN
jgi:hypothetical protein